VKCPSRRRETWHDLSRPLLLSGASLDKRPFNDYLVFLPGFATDLLRFSILRRSFFACL
jgi:hypothetical protein